MPTVSDIKTTTEQKMNKALEMLRNELTKIRTGRAHTGLLDSIMVDYYGQMVPISQVATVTLVDARTIGVQPWEKKMGPVIEKAIRESNLGLNPQSQAETIRVPTPALTEERRRELVKVIKGEGESTKVAIRNLRRDANTHLKDLVKAKTISEDEERRATDDVQKFTDKFVADIDKIIAQKDAEIMSV